MTYSRGEQEKKKEYRDSDLNVSTISGWNNPFSQWFIVHPPE